MTAGSTLWESSTAIVVAKPAGMLVHNSAFAGGREPSLRQAVGARLGRRVYPVHRLDRGTSGAVLFAHEKEYVEAWSKALAAPDAVKIYLAICRGRLTEPHDVTRPVPGSDGVRRDARSEIAPIAVSERARVSLVAVRIHTGRHHQVRRHLAGLSHPVVNDSTHGNSRFNREFRQMSELGRLALHAWRLEVTDPFVGEAAVVTCPLPDDLSGAVSALFPDDVQRRTTAALADLTGRPLGEESGPWSNR